MSKRPSVRHGELISASLRAYVTDKHLDLYENPDIEIPFSKIDSEQDEPDVDGMSHGTSLGFILRQERLPSARDLLVNRALTIRDIAEIRKP